MKKTTLVIMAAGLGSRFGEGLKQLAKVGPSGEIIMDYSIHDALEAGFDKIVFIIRKDIEADFKEVIGNRIEKIADVAYAYQELDKLPEGFTKPADRTKPFGYTRLTGIYIEPGEAYVTNKAYAAESKEEKERLENEINIIKTEIKETDSRIEEKTNLLENSTPEELVERYARERLGYCFPNEVVFVDVS